MGFRRSAEHHSWNPARWHGSRPRAHAAIHLASVKLSNVLRTYKAQVVHLPARNLQHVLLVHVKDMLTK